MAGVSDKIFRQICKEYGADVLTTEFVSSEGIFRRNERTREYLDFDEIERPIGVQLFGADPAHMGEAAAQVIDWVQPDFIDLNFGCPVNKVVAKNGGSALLKDCPTLTSVAAEVVRRWRRCRSRRRFASDGMPIRSMPRGSRSCSRNRASLPSLCTDARALRVTQGTRTGRSSRTWSPPSPFPSLAMAIWSLLWMWRSERRRPESRVP